MIGYRASSFLLVFLLLVAAVAVVPACAQNSSVNDASLDSSAQPPTNAELRQRREQLIANQHADDEALNFYERIERHVDRSSGSNPRVLDDRVYRVVPTGGGTMKILLRDHGAEVSPEDYQRQLRTWRDVLQMMTSAGDSKGATARAKYEKRERQRSEFVNATKDAFVPKWIGRETYAGRKCDMFELGANPEFHPSSMFEGALTHVTAKIWVDHSTNQLVRGEAWVTSDISFVAGIAGKVYRGSKVEIDQAEVAPGVWLPTHYEYDFAGRKFLFPFAQHETIDVSHYKRIGPPEDALAEVNTELASGKGPFDDP
ncbi:MAG: hypothetical protein ACRD4X_15055 [Candidatus Acidiferrales bacterium]